MRKITTLFILVLSMSFVSCDTFTRYVIRVSVDRHPILTIVNQTGHPAVVTAPISSNVASGGITLFQPTGANRSIDVTYRIGEFQFTEQVTVSDQDVTVTLTRRPPTITVINQTGHPVIVTAPASANVANGARTQLLPTALNQTIDVTYRIGQIQFTEQVTVSDQDVTVTLTRRPAVVTVVNQTGHPVIVTAPASANVANGTTIRFLTALNQTIGVAYSIGRMRFTEQVMVGNQDVTVTLTRRPATITVVNNTGVTITNLFIRDSGDAWGAFNVLGAQPGQLARSLTNGDRIEVSLAEPRLEISLDRTVDIRIDDTHGVSYVRGNINTANDITLAFTQAHRP